MSALRFVGGGGAGDAVPSRNPGLRRDGRHAVAGRTDGLVCVALRIPAPRSSSWPQCRHRRVLLYAGGGSSGAQSPPPSGTAALLPGRCSHIAAVLGRRDGRGGAHKSPALHPLMAKRGTKDGVGTPGRIPADEGPALGAGR